MALFALRRHSTSGSPSSCQLLALRLPALHFIACMQVLLEAVQRYDQVCAAQPQQHPPLLVIITGKGPDKARYLELLRHVSLRRCVIQTAWLEPDDYAALLATADMGVSLHTSSSDLDLPMKVSDMLGWCATTAHLNVPVPSSA